MFEMNHTIPFTKCDPEQKLKLHEAVSYMMDCCQFQEYQEVAFRNFLESNHLAPRKVPVPASGGTAGKPTVITPSQLDPNGHLTSHMYFAIAADAIPANLAYNRVRMEFKNQIKQGETVTPESLLSVLDGDLEDEP